MFKWNFVDKVKRGLNINVGNVNGWNATFPPEVKTEIIVYTLKYEECVFLL
jgi:hypothetical protein